MGPPGPVPLGEIGVFIDYCPDVGRCRFPSGTGWAADHDLPA